MPNKYKRREGCRNYHNYTNETLQNALCDVTEGKLSYRKASAKYKIPISTISRKLNGKNMKKFGGQNVLSENEEQIIVDTILYTSDWGYPFEMEDVKCLVKSYLDRAGRKLKPFKNNKPGDNWYHSFLNRHKNILKSRLSENIKRSRAAVSRKIVNDYFDNLDKELLNIPPENIINYDETNFMDDPGRTKVLVRRTSKHADNIMDSTKTATSVMFAVDASGSTLPPYVVYKSLQLWEPWTLGGPDGCRYNRTPSGWFDQSVFEDWFQTIILPHCRRLEGVKAVIGDNLASHLSVKIVELCQQHNIKFIFLPPNSTHICQPLDVSYFRPLKIAWRKVLKEYKSKKKGSIAKDIFPRLLKATLQKVALSSTNNIKSGFEATGIYPLDRSKVLKRLPEDHLESPASTIIPQALHDMLHESRFGKENVKRSKRKRYNIKAGCSVTEQNMLVDDEIENEINIESERENVTARDIETENTSEMNIDTEIQTLTDGNTGTEDLLIENLKTDDFILTEFETVKGNKAEFVGQIIMKEDSGFFSCRFLRKSQKMSGYYSFPFVIDEASVSSDQIIKKMTILHERRGNYRFL